MLNIQLFTFNPFQENTYLLINEKKHCWIVDPGMYYADEKQQLTDYISENHLVPQGIINTHAHIDHIFGVTALVDQYNIPFSIHEKELPILNAAPGSAMLFGFRLKQTPVATSYITEKEHLKLGDDTLEVRFTPGHSPGSISFHYAAGGWILAGDVLFSGSIGRTDLPGGDMDTLINSIKTQLFTLPADTAVYSGHGPSTTIAYEMAHNPFLQ